MTSGASGAVSPTKWVPAIGEFETDGGSVVFHGKRVPRTDQAARTDSDPKDQAGIGLALCNIALADGVVTADVIFRAMTPESVCEVAIAYDANAYHIVAAGLGSEPPAMFGIREFGSQKTANQAWWNYRLGGERQNLKANQPYHLEVRLRGANVVLLVDDVNVGSAEVTSPQGRARNVGLFCKGDHLIEVSHFQVDADKPKAFVVMQFLPEFDDVYHDVVKEVSKDYGVNVLRADEVNGPGLIVGDIAREISTAQLVIADITPTNANVYFEVGYALALGKPTILLARKGTSLPFDVAGFRVLFYEDTIGGKRRLEDGLRRHLDAILAK